MQHAIKRVALPTYYAHDDPSSNEMLLLLFQSYTLTGLNTYTQYLVSLKAYNPAGAGPETIVVVMTDEGGMYKLYFFWPPKNYSRISIITLSAAVSVSQ